MIWAHFHRRNLREPDLNTYSTNSQANSTILTTFCNYQDPWLRIMESTQKNSWPTMRKISINNSRTNNPNQTWTIRCPESTSWPITILWLIRQRMKSLSSSSSSSNNRYRIFRLSLRLRKMQQTLPRTRRHGANSTSILNFYSIANRLISLCLSILIQIQTGIPMTCKCVNIMIAMNRSTIHSRPRELLSISRKAQLSSLL